MFDGVPDNWKHQLQPAFEDDGVQAVGAWLDERCDVGDSIPRRDRVFRALELTPFDAVRVVILGQDPYPTPGRADGLAFSVPLDVLHPATLRNILGELARDNPQCDRSGVREPTNDAETLAPWARQGVLLLNTALTLRNAAEGPRTTPRSLGWTSLTRAILGAVAQHEHVVFMLWGMKAIDAGQLVRGSRHSVIESTHPARLSWKRRSPRARPFYGSSPFSRANNALREHGQVCIDWRLEQPTGIAAMG